MLLKYRFITIANGLAGLHSIQKEYDTKKGRETVAKIIQITKNA